MRFPYENLPAWFIAQEFGVKTSYGFHTGEDWNLRTGGMTDLGQSIHAITDGEVINVDEDSANPSYGLHIHYKITGPWGERVIHHAHLSKVFVEVGQKIVEGQIIAEVGNSGTGSAHDHLEILKVFKSARAVAKKAADLTNYEDPSTFINKWISYKPESDPAMNISIIDLDKDLPTELENIYHLKEKPWYPKRGNFQNMIDVVDEMYEELEEREEEMGDKDAEIARLRGENVKLETKNNDMEKDVLDIMDTAKQMKAAMEELNVQMTAMKSQGFIRFKSALLSKGFWLNALGIVSGAIIFLNDPQILQDHPQIAGAVISAFGIINLIIRFLSTQGIYVPVPTSLQIKKELPIDPENPTK